MELELTRVDYTVVGVTNSNCLVLMPGNLPKEQCKVAIVDEDGVLQVFSIKKDEIVLHFKTLPGPPISSLKYVNGSGLNQGKIFVASKNEVRGYSQRGKLFLTFDSGLTEPISTMFVMDNDLFLCGKHIYTHYRDCREVGSYLCGDKIVDVVAFYSTKSRRLMSIIACEGRMCRILEHARVTCSLEVDTSPTILHLHEDDDSRSVLFGTIDGRVGILNVGNLQAFKGWLISNENNSSSINCMDSYDLNGSDTNQLIIGRQDGMIEVYQLSLNLNVEVIQKIFSFDCNERVTALKCGVIGEQGFNEILVTSYTGRVFGLTTQPISTHIDNSEGKYVFSTNSSEKIHKLRVDIEDLKTKILKEREKYQTSTQSFYNELSAIPLLTVNERFILDRESATYTLSIGIPTPIDFILIQCDAKIELMDEQKNSAVVSYTDSKQGNQTLVTYRCQMNVNNLELKVRTTEGERGTLAVYVTPMIQPKCSRKLTYDIRPLSLHYKLNKCDSNRSYNILNIKGSFSLAEIHTWIAQTVPQVPEKPDLGEVTVLSFESCLLGTILECTYQQGKAEFRSDNISTLTTLKNSITKEATKKKIKLEIDMSVNDESVKQVLLLVDKIITNCLQKSKELRLLNALNEIDVTAEESVKYLSDEYKELLAREENIRKTMIGQDGNIEILLGLYTYLQT
ncbi:unnamed protein product [Acanthoscelides obtectus]|uniref:Bardet-Biedl syndrome 7 protein n=1 Tax=Acanthoscelides obtectus TaxID=200917 RepID=A0A9P0LKN9_ACAOB|nr:unnamed protein product [Acanthoscelides obtectus]CAK1621701.1 Bardet-Biedl syndrome 7 protein homolog [Acanthoscelides obtectus]